MVQIGFEPKVAFLCPACNKEVEMVYERGKGEWGSDHGNCLNFSFVRDLPRINGRACEGPVVFISMESDFSIRETVEGLRRLCADESDLNKRQKLETGIRRLETRPGFAERSMAAAMDSMKSGAFGIRVVSGRGIYATVWKSGERYFGAACGDGQADPNSIVATSSVDEAQRFVAYWMRYWDSRHLV